MRELLMPARFYPGFSVGTMATEITYENQTHYYVNIADGKKMMRLRFAVNDDIAVDSKKKI